MDPGGVVSTIVNLEILVVRITRDGAILMDGEDDGAEEADGELEGVAEGRLVGLIDGDCEGFLLGDCVGINVGMSDGEIDGIALGNWL